MWTEEELETEIKNKEGEFSLEEKHENFLAAVRKWEMLAATKVGCSRAKQRQRKVPKKSVLHVQTCFLLIRPIKFSPFSGWRRLLALHDCILCLSKL